MAEGQNNGIVVCGHGTRNENGIQAFLKVFEMVKSHYVAYRTDYGFIEYSAPLFGEVIEKQITEGINNIVVVPAILYTGVHIRNDIPFVIKQLQDKYPDVTIKLAGHLGNCAPIVQICCDNLHELKNNSAIDIGNKKALLVIGVGSSVLQANVDIAMLTRLLWEKCGYQYGLYAFISRMTFPDIDESLQILANSDYNEIHIIPVLLFPGVYLNKILLKIEAFKQHTNKTICISNTLENQELIMEGIRLRIDEVLHGKVDLASALPDGLSARK